MTAVGAVAIVLAILAIVGVFALGYAVGRSRGTRPASHPGSWQDLELELERARRHARPFGFVLLPSDVLPPDPVAIDGLLRAGDKAWRDAHGAWILVPEAGREELDGALRRLGSRPTWAGAIGSARSVVFPDDGLTAGALVATLRGQPVGAVPTPLFPREVDEAAWTIVRDAQGRDGSSARTG